MLNKDKWQPSKYIFKKGKLIASRDRREVCVASRLITDLTAEFYDKTLRQHATGTLLDLGCGKVPLYNAYKKYIADNVCVDWENTLHKNKYLDFECDLTKGLPFEDREFNTIILSDVLEHIPQPEELFKEIFRILSTNGKVFINVPFYYWIHEYPHDYYRYTEFALKRFVYDSGLTLVQFERIGGSPEILADILAKHFKPISLIGAPLAICIQCSIRIFVKTKLGRKISDKTSKTFPFGYFLIAEKIEAT